MKFILKSIYYLFLGLIWLFVYAQLIHLYFMTIWDFNLFNPASWKLIPEEWKNGLVIDTASEFFFFASLFLIIPVFIIGFILLARTHWLKSFGKFIKALKDGKTAKQRRQADAFPSARELAEVFIAKANQKKQGKGAGTERPPMIDGLSSLGANASAAKALYGKAKAKAEAADISASAQYEDNGKEVKDKRIGKILSSDHAVLLQTKAASAASSPEDGVKLIAPSASPSFSASSATSSSPSRRSSLSDSVVLPEPTLTSRIDSKYEVLRLTEKLNIYTAEELKMGEDTVDFAFVGNKHIYLVNFEPIGSEWIADETVFENEEPLWFSETKYENSPVFKLSRAAKVFKRALDETMAGDPTTSIPEIKKIFLIGGANILNYDDMKPEWDELGVEVYRLSTGLPESVPELKDFLARFKSEATMDASLTDKVFTAFMAAEP